MLQPTFEEQKAKKLTDLSVQFSEAQKQAHLLSAVGFTIDANDEVNRNVSGLVTLMSTTDAPTNLQFCDCNNQLHTVTLTDLKVMQTEIIVNGSALYAKKWSYRDVICAATTTDELDAIVISF